MFTTLAGPAVPFLARRISNAVGALVRVLIADAVGVCLARLMLYVALPQEHHWLFAAFADSYWHHTVRGMTAMKRLENVAVPPSGELNFAVKVFEPAVRPLSQMI